MKKNEPLKILLYPDEIKHLFEVSKTGKDSKGSNVLTHMLRLFESNKSGNATRQHGNMQISNAHLAVIGAATKESHEDMWQGTKGGKNGLQSRITLVSTNMGVVPANRRPSDVGAAEQALNRISEQLKNAPALIHVTGEANALFLEWCEFVKESCQSIRLSDIVKRFCIVLAVTNDTDTVTLELMRQATAFGSHVLAAREKYNPDDASGNVQAFEQRILKAFKKHGPMTKRQVMQVVGPNKFSGGYQAFGIAWGGLLSAEAVELKAQVGRKAIYQATVQV